MSEKKGVDNQEHTNCLVCYSDKIYDLKGFEKAYLCKCSSCNFIFSRKIPTQTELDNHYISYKYGENPFISPVTLKRYNELLDNFEKFKKTNRIIDVGCGNGDFLGEAKKRGWEVYGTEFPDDAIESCKKKGIKMYKGFLNPDDFEPEYFDIITSFEVIEHINNPREELGYFNKILRKGGLVYITTPNFNSLLRYRLKDKYSVINYPGHLSYYTPKTLKKVFKYSGFRALKVKTTGISITRYKKSKGISNQSNVSSSSDDEVFRNKIESKKHLQIAKSIVNLSLTVTGKGDSLKGWFIKK